MKIIFMLTTIEFVGREIVEKLWEDGFRPKETEKGVRYLIKRIKL